ncbi:MAG: serine/threonine protein kinase [Kofleriaceae bacterium]|nr:serine/threonine protein kinase [Kofleriaceae bacterium]
MATSHATSQAELGSTSNRLARALASPTGVIVTVPLLVVVVGLGVLWFGRQANRTASLGLVQQQLAGAADHVGQQVAYALDQAQPILDRLVPIARADAPIEVVAPTMHDLTLGHAGVSHLSVSFPVGMLRSSYYEGSSLRVQQSTVGTAGSIRNNFVVDGNSVRVIEEIKNSYDPRTRPFYRHAESVTGRSWTPPRTYFSTKTTGISAVQAIRDAQGTLQAVLTVDFDINALSTYVSEIQVAGARSIVYSEDGAIFVYAATDRKAPQLAEERLLQVGDLNDPAIAALFTDAANLHPPTRRNFTINAGNENYIVAVTPIGGSRAGIATPLNWYVATVVPESTILASSKQLERRTVLVGIAAVGVAFALALVFAWNLVRLRRSVRAARQAATTAQAQVRELGSYRLVARIGEGGMGEVWRAEHRLLARQAAVKLLRNEASYDGEMALKIRERFRREAQALASMRSRHTIALFDYGVTDDGTFFYVMELLDGVDLETLVRQFGPQPPGRVILFLIQALSSLAEAHAAGLWHRDVKPANLFACRAADEVDILKVLDFGIVQAANESAHLPALPMMALPNGQLVPIPGGANSTNDPAGALPGTPRLTQMGAVLGTPGFMSPEQAKGLSLDGRSDLYALGCVAWWLLTGREVFPAESDAAVYYNHLYEPVPNLMEQAPQWIPPQLALLITACLQKEAIHRPASAKDLADQLRAIELPPELWWTADKAQQWWHTYRPIEPRSVGVELNLSQQRLLVPRRSDVAASPREARTVAERKRS